MTTLEDFFLSPEVALAPGAAPPVNPFADDDALLEAQIIEVRYDGIRSVLGIILEMRLAERISESSTALIVASEVTHYSWKQVDRKGGRTAWTIIGSVPEPNDPGVKLHLTLSPSAALSFTSNRASFYSVRINELENAAPPDYVEESLSEIRNGIARWNSEVDVVHSVCGV